MKNYNTELVVEDNYHLRDQNWRLASQNKRLGEKLKVAMSVNDQLKEHNKTYLNEVAQLQAKVSVLEHQASLLKSGSPFYFFIVFVVGAMTGLIVKLIMS